MKLAYSTSSPWVRRVAVSVTELGLDDQVERVRVDNKNTDSAYAAVNPLLKVPSLWRDDGSVLIDSMAICEYLDGISDQVALFPAPGAERIEMLQQLVLVNGMQESVTQITGERLRRPAELRWDDFIEKLLFKVNNGFDRLEQESDFLKKPVNYAIISTAVLCASTDFRIGDLCDWRAGHPKIAAWFAGFEQRPSMTGSVFSVSS